MVTRIAVVDHDPLFLTLLQEAVSADGYEVQRLFVGIGANDGAADVSIGSPPLQPPYPTTSLC